MPSREDVPSTGFVTVAMTTPANSHRAYYNGVEVGLIYRDRRVPGVWTLHLRGVVGARHFATFELAFQAAEVAAPQMPAPTHRLILDETHKWLLQLSWTAEELVALFPDDWVGWEPSNDELRKLDTLRAWLGERPPDEWDAPRRGAVTTSVETEEE